MGNKSRSNQKQVWCDKEFVDTLNKLKAEKVLEGYPVKNIGELTKEIINSPSFKQVVDDILKRNKQIDKQLGIRVDKKL